MTENEKATENINERHDSINIVVYLAMYSRQADWLVYQMLSVMPDQLSLLFASSLSVYNYSLSESSPKVIT